MKSLSKILPIFEQIFIATLTIYLILNLLGLVYTVLLIIGLLGLSTIFFLSAYVPSEANLEGSKQSGFVQLLVVTIIPKVLGISSSVAIVGILFHTLKMEGSPLLLTVGSLNILVSVLILTILKVFGVREVDTVFPKILRSAIVLFFSGYLVLTSF